ncbi:MAG TPA: hypothetical protein VH684_03595 [Xanthobacteraceae bacterium]|jgi:hypothetical protein
MKKTLVFLLASISLAQAQTAPRIDRTEQTCSDKPTGEHVCVTETFEKKSPLPPRALTKEDVAKMAARDAAWMAYCRPRLRLKEPNGYGVSYYEYASGTKDCEFGWYPAEADAKANVAAVETRP